MLVLRADPWDPGYGMGFEASAVDDAPQDVDPGVETDDWSRPLSPPPPPLPDGICFVDGVRRIDLRLIAAEGERRAPGLFGSLAVGSVHVDGRARFGEHVVERACVVGGGLRPDETRVRIGGQELAFRPVSDLGEDPNQPLWRLQELMRRAEARLAAALLADGARIVLADGPLSYPDPGGAPIVGVVKRFAHHYLSGEHAALLARLDPGTRTPLFGLGSRGSGLQRYAWYVRLQPLRPEWHDHAGLMRCEVQAAIGLDGAIGLADEVAATLPRYAGRASDPRAPQNLVPVGALEQRLRHRLGDQRLVRRALTATLTRRGGEQ